MRANKIGTIIYFFAGLLMISNIQSAEEKDPFSILQEEFINSKEPLIIVRVYGIEIDTPKILNLKEELIAIAKNRESYASRTDDRFALITNEVDKAKDIFAKYSAKTTPPSFRDRVFVTYSGKKAELIKGKTRYLLNSIHNDKKTTQNDAVNNLDDDILIIKSAAWSPLADAEVIGQIFTFVPTIIADNNNLFMDMTFSWAIPHSVFVSDIRAENKGKLISLKLDQTIVIERKARIKTIINNGEAFVIGNVDQLKKDGNEGVGMVDVKCCLIVYPEVVDSTTERGKNAVRELIKYLKKR